MDGLNNRCMTSQALRDVLVIVVCDGVGTAIENPSLVVNRRILKLLKVNVSLEIFTRQAPCGVIVCLEDKDFT